MSEPVEPWTDYSWTYVEREHVEYENALWLDDILDRVRWPIDDEKYEASLDGQAVLS